MTAALRRFFDDLDKSRLRVSHPYPLIFLCGGKVGKSGPAQSLRDYIYRTKRIAPPYRVVLAEEANQLYRDTKYRDLISFEEDIARIASLIVVIAESPGSLAELGAFAASTTIRPSLRILLQEQYASDESFIRYGPVQRIKNDNADYVGVFPWKTRKDGALNVSSVTPHAAEIAKFLSDHMKRIPASTGYTSLHESHAFFLIYWIIYLGLALSRSAIMRCVQEILPNLQPNELRNKIYCMEIAGWVGRISYSGKEYLYALDGDPFDYSFKSSTQERDSLRRKVEVVRSITDLERAPDHVREVATAARGLKL